MTTKTMMIFGMGFTAKVLARAMLAQGWRVRGTSRSGDISVEGVQGYRFGGQEPVDPKALDGISHVLSTIPVIDGDDRVLALHGETLAQANIWSGYISATSVYSESDGGWVTEDSPTEPSSRRGQWRRQAEVKWQDILGAEVFRAAGIYGAGRSPFKKLLKGEGRIISKPGHAFNRIHVDDIARVIMAAMAKPSPKRILNLADGSPCEAGDVVRFAADLLGVKAPAPIPFEDADMTPMARSFYATSRKVDASRIKTEFGLDLLHQNYQSGLTATLAEERRLGILPKKPDPKIRR